MNIFDRFKPHACERATLTFLDDDRLILGVPKNMDQDKLIGITQSLLDYDQQRMMVFPFPIDVVDKRTANR